MLVSTSTTGFGPEGTCGSSFEDEQEDKHAARSSMGMRRFKRSSVAERSSAKNGCRFATLPSLEIHFHRFSRMRGGAETHGELLESPAPKAISVFAGQLLLALD